jgi:hypothetical protein
LHGAAPAVPGARADRSAVPEGLLLRGASTDAVDWRAFELTGVRLDLGQAVQVARAHGALVA